MDAWFNDCKIDFTSEKFRHVLFSKDSLASNLIHTCFRELLRRRGGGRTVTVPPEVINGIKALVLLKPEQFTDEDAYSSKPIYQAVKHAPSILFRVVDQLAPKAAQKLSGAKLNSITSKNMRCPSWVTSEGHRIQCREISKSLKAPDDMANTHTSLSKGDRENGRLYNHIDPDEVSRQNELLSKKIKKELGKHCYAECLKPLLTAERVSCREKDASENIPVESFKILLGLCPDTVFADMSPGYPSPLQLAVQLYHHEDIDAELLLSVIKALVDRCSGSIFLDMTFEQEKTNVYRLLKKFESLSTMNPRMVNSIGRAAEFIKRVCIGSHVKSNDKVNGKVESLMWTEEKNFVYGDLKLERNIYLNLMGESTILNKSYIDVLKTQSGMVFETVLYYVKLPYWKPRALQPNKLEAESVEQSEQTPGLVARAGTFVSSDFDPYIAIFDWLCNDGVNKIFTLEVDDNGPEPHTNVAIRGALRGISEDGKIWRKFEIEVWEWKKLDICCETVATVAPDAREVHLYSSGNTAVLRGWAGGSSLAKMTKLEKLVVEVYPQSVGDETDCSSYQKEFENSIKRQCPWLDKASRGDDRDLENKRRKPGGKQHQSPEVIPKPFEWVHQLEGFKSFLQNIHLNKEKTVKVAILDDGCRLQDLDGKQKGQSFRLDNEEFFVGPCSHGTQMANCIREVCPMAELYIARLDDSRLGENQKFTILSCHQALQWALEMKVDIISMNWTFQRKPKLGDDEHQMKFISLINTVAYSRVLLFGALPDKSSAVEVHQVLPSGLGGVFRIGSASIHSEISPENIYEKPDFILPGEAIKLTTGDIARGSSFSTAYAAGLAALVLYCLMAHKELSQDDDAAKTLHAARMHSGMRIIFNILSRKPADNGSGTGAFVQPYHTFGHEFSDSQEEKIKILYRIAGEVLPAVNLEAMFL